MSQSDHKISIDQTDHAQPYRHEITISVGGDEDVINVKSSNKNDSPSPSPRSLQSSQGADEISASSTDDDNAILTPGRKNNGETSGLDNPAFENDNKTSQQRPMSSFGQNGGKHANGREQTKGNGFDKPLAGKTITK